MKAHKLARLFPEIPEDEFDNLVEDVKAKGCFEPVVTYQGEVLDGWHRWKACQKAGVEPALKEYKGADPLGYVISKNLMRRHLRAEQRLAIAANIAREAGTLVRMPKGVRTPKDAHWPQANEAPAITTGADIASMAGVGHARTSAQAVTVALDRPDLSAKVAAGTMPLTEAYLAVKQEQHRPVNTANKERRFNREQQLKVRDVAKFLKALDACSDAISDAKDAYKFGKFAPEAARFAARNMRSLIAELDKLATKMEESK